MGPRRPDEEIGQFKSLAFMENENYKEPTNTENFNEKKFIMEKHAAMGERLIEVKM